MLDVERPHWPIAQAGYGDPESHLRSHGGDQGPFLPEVPPSQGPRGQGLTLTVLGSLWARPSQACYSPRSSSPEQPPML